MENQELFQITFYTQGGSKINVIPFQHINLYIKKTEIYNIVEAEVHRISTLDEEDVY